MDVVVESTVVVREVSIAARPETVWEFLVDPVKAIQWMGISASLEPRPGGKYHVEVIPGHTAIGEFTEVVPHRRLAFKWGWQGSEQVPPGSSTVVFELIAKGPGTLLRLTHRDLPNADAAASHARGWNHYLDRIAAIAAGYDPGVDPWIADPMC